MSVRHPHAVLHRALADGVKRGRLTRNPCDAVDVPTVGGAADREMKTWTAEEAKAFLEVTRGDRLAGMRRLALSNGLRRGELCRLQWADVDLTVGTLAVRRALVSAGYKVKLQTPKTKKGTRTMGLASETVAALKRQAGQQTKDAAKRGDVWQDTGFVFTAEDGQPMHPDRVSKLFDDAVSKAPVPRIRLHDLRHTCATLALRAGIHPKVVQEMLGHATIGITLDSYSHAVQGMQEDAAQRIGALLEPTKK
jgi:integrase